MDNLDISYFWKIEEIKLFWVAWWSIFMQWFDWKNVIIWFDSIYNWIKIREFSDKEVSKKRIKLVSEDTKIKTKTLTSAQLRYTESIIKK